MAVGIVAEKVILFDKDCDIFLNMIPKIGPVSTAMPVQKNPDENPERFLPPMIIELRTSAARDIDSSQRWRQEVQFPELFVISDEEGTQNQIKIVISASEKMIYLADDKKVVHEKGAESFTATPSDARYYQTLKKMMRLAQDSYDSFYSRTNPDIARKLALVIKYLRNRLQQEVL